MTLIIITYLATAMLALTTDTAVLVLLTTIALAVLPREPATAHRFDLSEITERN
ncbi:hypothetical protein [Kocuria sp. WRN011]|uniref:hypothetical protein n=1 Tax=Kocuria sp. WRN011 TaxID=2029858 RepID=UPI001304164E|nr:hypothetical protein [Kocuria sp. WRN011]